MSKLALQGWLIRLDHEHTYFFARGVWRLFFHIADPVSKQSAEAQLATNPPLQAVFFAVPLRNTVTVYAATAESDPLQQALYRNLPTYDQDGPSLNTGTCVVVMVNE